MSSTYSSTGSEEQSRSDQAKEQGQQVASRAQEEARATTDTAKQEAGQVAEEAKQQVRGLIGNLRYQLQDQAEQQTDRIANLLLELQRNLEALQEGNTEEAGPLGEYVQRASDEVERLAERVDELGFQGLTSELQRFARRRPGVFLGSAVAMGFLAGRLGRGARDAQQPDRGLGGGSSGSRGRRSLPETTSSGTTSTDRDRQIDVSDDQPLGRSAGTVETPVATPTVSGEGTRAPATGLDATPPADRPTESGQTPGETDPLRSFGESDR